MDVGSARGRDAATADGGDASLTLPVALVDRDDDTGGEDTGAAGGGGEDTLSSLGRAMPADDDDDEPANNDNGGGDDGGGDDSVGDGDDVIDFRGLRMMGEDETLPSRGGNEGDP